MQDVRDMENPLCLDVFSILDYLVEGDETYTMSLSSNNQIVNINEPIIEITIKDRDCKYKNTQIYSYHFINFKQTCLHSRTAHSAQQLPDNNIGQEVIINGTLSGFQST